MTGFKKSEKLQYQVNPRARETGISRYVTCNFATLTAERLVVLLNICHM